MAKTSGSGVGKLLSNTSLTHCGVEDSTSSCLCFFFVLFFYLGSDSRMTHLHLNDTWPSPK